MGILDPKPLTVAAGNATYAPASGSPNYASVADLAAKPDAVPNGLEVWRMALANRDFARADIACLGDSVTEGRGATSYDRNWVHKLQTGLRKRLGVTGGYGYMPARLTDTTTYAHPTTNSGAIFYNQNFGVKGYMTLLDGASTITYNITGTHADIIYLSGGATGVMRYIVDGGTQQTLDTSDPTLQMKRLRLNLGASGAHTITIGFLSGPNVYLDGVIIYDGDTNAGIGVHDCGHSGWTTGNWMSNAANWPSQITTAFQPDLWIVGLGINDSFGAPNSPNISVAQYKTNLGNIITNIQNATGPDPSILLHTSIPRKPATSGYGAYVTAMKDLATERGVAFYDHLSRWPNSETTAGWYVDGTHPADIGYSALADDLAEFLAPS